MGEAVGASARPLGREQRERGRRLAIASHPFGMTFRTVFTSPLPTLALLALGASESIVGLQSAIVSISLLLQFPMLRLVSLVSKRNILVGAHAFAVFGALPLLAYRHFAAIDSGIAIACVCFAAAAAGISASETVWFPLLRSYVEPGMVGRFFGMIRSGWHLTLIVYFLGSQAWLARHPGDFAPLFAIGALCGLIRIALIVRLPERDERTGERIQARQAFSLLRDPAIRNYLAGVSCSAAVRASLLPFAVVLLRREVGLNDAVVLNTAIATFSGGLISLYLWGRAVDRFGSAPIIRWTSLAMGGLAFGLAALASDASDSATLAGSIAFFFGFAVLSAGFGVADTQILFSLAPAHAPSRALVLASVVVGSAGALTPALAGWLLEQGLGAHDDRMAVYRWFFAALACLQVAAGWPLYRLQRITESQRKTQS
jgi:predicted MFS family arabinose efflux permease